MRFYDAKTQTEAIKGVHNLKECTPINKLPLESQMWFDPHFKMPEGKEWGFDALTGFPVLEQIKQIDIEEIKKQWFINIDQAADDARKKLMNTSTTVALEYQRSYNDAQQFITNNYQGKAPRSVTIHAGIYSTTNKQAADIIKKAGDAWFVKLDFIRETRLYGKKMIQDAPLFITAEIIYKKTIKKLTTITQD